VTERIVARYLLETAVDPRQAAEAIAGEQSSGTFRPVPGETAELKRRAGARIERLEVVEEVAAPSLPGAATGPDGRYRRAELTLSWPLENSGPSLPNLVATVAGNLFEMHQVSGLRILDIALPEAFYARYPGPRFGIEGTRRLSGVHGRPLIGTIVKPSVGLDAEATAKLVASLCDAGIDFVKDDELQADGASCPFAERARAVMRAIDRHADRSGRKVMFAFNITDDLDAMRRHHDLVLELGGSCVMVSLNSVGLVGMIEIARHAQLPIHAHRNGWGYLSRHPQLGWSYVAWQKLWRLAGADHMHVNGLRNKFCESDNNVVASARECLTPMSAAHPCIAMPVVSSGQSVHQVQETHARLGSVDLIFAAGGGIMAHPQGPAAGVRSLREAWDAAIAGVDVAERARSRPELAAALEAFRK
jgi:ribulose-bisphosphate carboxylase large chain